MIDKLLPIITDAQDYMTALSFFQMSGPPAKEDVARLLPVYAKYSGADAGPEYAKLCLAIDLLPGRSRENAADFAALELGADLDALFLAQELAGGMGEMSVEQANAVTAAVKNEAVSIPARVLLARTASDAMAGVLNFAEIQGQVRETAEFLIQMGPAGLDRYTALATEVRMKCRK